MEIDELEDENSGSFGCVDEVVSSGCEVSSTSGGPDELSDSVLFNNNNDQGEVANNGKQTNILRPCGMMLMSMTEEDYQTQYWPKLQGAVTQLLSMKPGEYIPISYEQMYSCVYKCVCKQFTERLYQDLLDHVTAHLGVVNQHLHALDGQPTVYIESFAIAMSQYNQALTGIVPIFNYMNRFYVERTLRTDLKLELTKLFVTHVADRHVPIVLQLLQELSSRPFAVKPSVIAQLVADLHALKPVWEPSIELLSFFKRKYAKQRPHFFAKYIPNVLPPLSESDLPAYIEEVKQTTRDLRMHPIYTSGDQSRKRSGDEEFMAFPGHKS